jgi:hypothetical protein
LLALLAILLGVLNKEKASHAERMAKAFLFSSLQKASFLRAVKQKSLVLSHLAFSL